MRRTAIDTLATEIIPDEKAFNWLLFPADMAIDREAGALYLTDQSLHAIIRVGVDGSNPVKLIEQGVVNPMAVTWDPIGQRVYWSNSEARRLPGADEFGRYLMSASLDGTDVRKVAYPSGIYGSIDIATDLAIIPMLVPEPAAAILLITAASLGPFCRRRGGAILWGRVTGGAARGGRAL